MPKGRFAVSPGDGARGRSTTPIRRSGLTREDARALGGARARPSWQRRCRTGGAMIADRAAVPTLTPAIVAARHGSTRRPVVVGASRDARLDEPLRAAAAAMRDGRRSRPTSPRPCGRCTSASASIPTKTRPSSEALLRRVRKGDELPRINSLVDVINWCSLESQLPFGLYDLDRIHGAVTLRLGRRGRGVRRHPQGRRAPRRPPDAGRRRRPVRQSDVGLGAHDGDARRRRARWS